MKTEDQDVVLLTEALERHLELHDGQFRDEYGVLESAADHLAAAGEFGDVENDPNFDRNLEAAWVELQGKLYRILDQKGIAYERRDY